MNRRPLRWRVLDQVDRARDTADTTLAMAVTVLAIGWTMLPRPWVGGSEQRMADRRADRDPAAGAPIVETK